VCDTRARRARLSHMGRRTHICVSSYFCKETHTHVNRPVAGYRSSGWLSGERTGRQAAEPLR
jgi:hypothetical protein